MHGLRQDHPTACPVGAPGLGFTAAFEALALALHTRTHGVTRTGSTHVFRMLSRRVRSQYC